jgi:hypothetical protein
MGASTAHRCTTEFCERLVESCSDEWIRFPTGEEIKDCIHKMSKRAGLPQAALQLAVDGCHIPITAPKDNPEDYFNRKGFFSMNMQGIVDSDAMFRSVQVNVPGKVHDSKAWNVSQARQEVQNHFGISACVVDRGATHQDLFL